MGIKDAVVSHDGINNKQSSFFQKIFFYGFDHFDLTDAAEISADNDVVFEIKAFPMCQNGWNIVAEIAKGVPLESACMGRKDSGGENVASYAAGRNDRQGNGQRTFTDTGYVIDGKNTHKVQLRMLFF